MTLRLNTIAAAIALTAAQAVAQSGNVEIEQRLDFKPGTAKARAILMRVPAVRDMVEEGFAVATVDLNDDGRKEIIVLAASASYCGSGGCALVVLEQQGSKMKTLATLGTDGALGVTRQRFGAYRALAALDQQGRVVIGNKPGAPLHGKPMVYPMAGAQMPTGAPLAPAKPAAESAMPSPGLAMADVVGIRIGMPAAQVQRALSQHNARLEIHPQHLEFQDTKVTALYGIRATNNDGTAGVRQNERLPGEVVEVELTLPPSEPRASTVTRSISFYDKVSRPTVASIVDGLAAKYGPRYEKFKLSAVETKYVWRLDGQMIDKGPAACPYTLMAIWPVLRHGTTIVNDMRDPRAAQQHARQCGSLAVATVMVNHLENELIATSLTVQMTSKPYRLQHLVESAKHFNSLNAQRKTKEAGAASGVKVKM